MTDSGVVIDTELEWVSASRREADVSMHAVVHTRGSVGRLVKGGLA